MRISTIIAACATSALLMGCASDKAPNTPPPHNPQDFPPYTANQPVREQSNTVGPANTQQMHAPSQPTPMERANSMY